MFCQCHAHCSALKYVLLCTNQRYNMHFCERSTGHALLFVCAPKLKEDGQSKKLLMLLARVRNILRLKWVIYEFFVFLMKIITLSIPQI